MILRKLRKDAEEYLGEEVTDAVITVPGSQAPGRRLPKTDSFRICSAPGECRWFHWGHLPGACLCPGQLLWISRQIRAMTIAHGAHNTTWTQPKRRAVSKTKDPVPKVLYISMDSKEIKNGKLHESRRRYTQ